MNNQKISPFSKGGSERVTEAELIEMAYQHLDTFGVVSGHAIDKEKASQEAFFNGYRLWKAAATTE